MQLTVETFTLTCSILLSDMGPNVTVRFFGILGINVFRDIKCTTSKRDKTCWSAREVFRAMPRHKRPIGSMSRSPTKIGCREKKSAPTPGKVESEPAKYYIEKLSVLSHPAKFCRKNCLTWVRKHNCNNHLFNKVKFILSVSVSIWTESLYGWYGVFSSFGNQTQETQISSTTSLA